MYSIGARALSLINTDTTNNNASGFDFRTDDTNGLLVTGSKIMGVYTSHTPSGVSGDIAFLTRNAGATIAEVMRLTSTGAVGIGTTSPIAKLSVVGDTRIKETTNSATALVIENATATSTVTISTIDTSANLFSIASSTGQSYFDITSNGNVGVGTSTPGYLLTVGSVSVAADVAGFANLNGECTINPNNAGLNCSSDMRLKKNIVSIGTATSTLEKVLSLNPVYYNWNAESSSTPQHSGFIAQEVLPIFPDLVSTTNNGFYALNYAGFVPYLVKAVQQLAAQTSSLVTTVAGFAHSFVSTDIHATEHLCVGSTCIDEAELKILLDQSGQSPIIITDVPPIEVPSPDTTASTTPLDTTASTTPPDAEATSTQP